MLRSPLICLYLDNVPDIQKAINVGKKAFYDRIVSRISSPQAGQRGNDKSKNKNDAFTRSDLLLSGEQWRRDTILKVNETGDCESQSKTVQKQSIRNLKEEIDFAKHLDSIACVIVTLNNNDSFNMARQLLDKFEHSGCVLAEMTIIDKSYFTQNYDCNLNKKINKSQASTMVWQRWNTFRQSIDFNRHFKVICFKLRRINKNINKKSVCTKENYGHSYLKKIGVKIIELLFFKGCFRTDYNTAK